MAIDQRLKDIISQLNKDELVAAALTAKITTEKGRIHEGIFLGEFSRSEVVSPSKDKIFEKRNTKYFGIKTKSNETLYIEQDEVKTMDFSL